MERLRRARMIFTRNLELDHNSVIGAFVMDE